MQRLKNAALKQSEMGNLAAERRKTVQLNEKQQQMKDTVRCALDVYARSTVVTACFLL